MSNETFASIAGLVSAMAFMGFVFGLAYFIVLHRTVVLVAAGRGWLYPSALTFGRVGLVTILFLIAVRLGATALLATFFGFLVARAVAVRAVRRVK